MAYTEQQLVIINQRANAVSGKQYIITTGKNTGTLFIGQLDGTLKWITDNFDTRAQEAVGSILENDSSANTIYDPLVPKITTGVNQMNLGDVLAFAAAN